MLSRRQAALQLNKTPISREPWASDWEAGRWAHRQRILLLNTFPFFKTLKSQPNTLPPLWQLFPLTLWGLTGKYYWHNKISIIDICISTTPYRLLKNWRHCLTSDSQNYTRNYDPHFTEQLTCRLLARTDHLFFPATPGEGQGQAEQQVSTQRPPTQDSG